MLLAIDTSSKACSAAVADDLGNVLSECWYNNGLTHSTTLLTLIDQALEGAGAQMAQVGAVAVSVGPGSYTGLRIGVSCAKGLAFANDLPCYGVSTLLGLAHNAAFFEGTVLSVLDARVGQVFCALFSVSGGIVTRLTDDTALTLAALEPLLPQRFAAVGDGAALIAAHFGADRVAMVPPHLHLQRAASVAMAALAGHSTVSAGALAPEYHRLSQAERERKERLL